MEREREERLPYYSVPHARHAHAHTRAPRLPAWLPAWLRPCQNRAGDQAIVILHSPPGLSPGAERAIKPPGETNFMVAGRGLLHSERGREAVMAAGVDFHNVHGLQI